jgi:hypothetical protein
MKALTDMLEQHYAYVDETTTTPSFGCRYLNTQIKCFGFKGEYLTINSCPDLHATVGCEHIIGSPDDSFTDKYILSVNNRHIGVCHTMQCVLNEVRKQLCL